ncbi:MAG TPA: 5'-nucleotidase [Abditibacteriaceae bacterium]|jgi:hypothetical protein
MKHFLRILFCAVIFCIATNAAGAAPLGKATSPFDNMRPDKTETAWGRLAADALQSAARTDIAFVNAGVLKRGVLKAGPIEATDLAALLAFGDDDVVTMQISGAQLRAALERAVQAFPTGSPAMLHCAGFEANFNSQAPINRRITLVRVGGREVKDADSFSVAMPVSLAEGGAGYYTIWNGRDARKTGVSLRAAIASLVKNQVNITPDSTPRLASQ